ncbi:MAG TPA: heavy metal-binding domain-containing protein [Micromonosporaceae bacterium]|jgi:uncharacterized protein YbjQ (UPF0145 family)
MLVVTTESIPGYQVHAVIGQVVGVTARTFNPFIEGVKSLNGKTNPQLLRLLAQIRQEAVARLAAAAERRGANAVLGMRFDTRDITPPWREICAYGTAVLVVPTGPAELADEPYPTPHQMYPGEPYFDPA